MKNKVIEVKNITAFSFAEMDTDTYETPTINWAAIGAVDVKSAREFANRLLEVCGRVENGDWDK